MKKLMILPAIIFAAIVIFKVFFIVIDISEQVVITQLGSPKKSHTNPGFYFRIPVIQEAVYMSKKLLEYDADPSEILTKDKKTLVIDNFCKWQIEEPLKFYLTVRDRRSALNRLDDIIYSEMRNELGQHNLIEVIKDNRDEIMENVTKLSREKAKEYGIYVHDIRIKRADLPTQNERAVFERMKAERNRIAKQYRSEGREEAQKIMARTDKEKAIILAEAYREVQEIKGETDAEVIKIYADAYNKDPEFFDFTRSLEVYTNSLNKDNTKFFMTTENELLKTFQEGK
ncbi:protease modulator HflC [Limisalsivibrio acetivorans]|uniref:protease modulator HflC n=1 Tax=Limisalsivibrio acetivorans TaxID=1304888 RepID=UPI0003B47FEC|nr:protease modulator HflC [Limisalsivibrio acetivorans]